MTNDEQLRPQVEPQKSETAPLGESEGFMTRGIYPEIVSLNNQEGPMKIDGHRLLIDEQRYIDERIKVRDSLRDAIENGDRDVFDRLTEGVINLRDLDEVEAQQLKAGLEDAFANRDASSLQFNQLNVDLLTRGIAERNVIRQGLEGEIKQHPFKLMDKDGEVFDLADLDYVFVKDKSGDSFKVIISAKRGIDGINIPEEKNDSRNYSIKLDEIEKDPVSGAIRFKLEGSIQKGLPVITTVEVITGPTDIYEILRKEEEKETIDARNARKRDPDPYYPPQPSSPPYNPPPPSTPRRSSESGGHGYVSYSR